MNEKYEVKWRMKERELRVVVGWDFDETRVGFEFETLLRFTDLILFLFKPNEIRECMVHNKFHKLSINLCTWRTKTYSTAKRYSSGHI